MERDPIVDETRRLREEYASKFAHDRDAIFDDILRRQKGKDLVAFPSRPPKHKPAPA